MAEKSTPAHNDLTIRAFLDLSTCHLRQDTSENLGSIEGVTAYQTPYGWLMYTPQTADEHADEADWPPELQPIVELARKHGCAYILFDRDASDTGLLPTFDW